MQDDLEIPATLVAGKTKCFGFPCLFDRKDDQFGVPSHHSLKSPLCSCVTPADRILSAVARHRSDSLAHGQRTTINVGARDYIFALPRTPIAMEAKLPDEKLSPEQEAMKRRTTANGWHWFTVHSLDEVRSVPEKVSSKSTKGCENSNRGNRVTAICLVAQTLKC